MLNDRENILSALREKPLKVYEIMKRANVVNEEACPVVSSTRMFTCGFPMAQRSIW